MPTNYPSGLDSFTTHHDGLGEAILAGDINKIQDAVAAIETELGLTPKGSSADVAARLTSLLKAASNLSDVASPSTARTNLGLGTAATLASSAVAQTANNLSDLANASTARTNLGLGTASTLASSAVAQTANNLSDVASATTARSNLGASQEVVRTAVKTSSYTASAGDLVPVDTTSGNVTIGLPTAPPDKSRVVVKHVVRGGTNTVTVVCGGSDVFNVTSGATSLTLTLVAQAFTAVYNAAGGIWTVVSDDLPLSQLDSRYSALPATGDAILYVSATGNDSSNGLSWGSAKATIEAAYSALPSTGGIIEVGAGTFQLAATGSTTGLTIAKPVGFRGRGRTVSIIKYVGTGIGIQIGDGTHTLLDWGFFEDIQIFASANASVTTVFITDAHRGYLLRSAVLAQSNPSGSICLRGLNAYQNYIKDSLIAGSVAAVQLETACNDFSILDTSMDSTGIVCHITDSSGVRIHGGQISGLGSPCGVQVDCSVASGCTGFELLGAYFDSGSGGVTVGVKIAPLATSAGSVSTPFIQTACPPGIVLDKTDQARAFISGVASGKSVTLTSNCSDAMVMFHSSSGGTYSDSGSRTTKLGANTSGYYASSYVASNTSAGFKHSPASASGQALWVEVAGDANPKFTLRNDGFMAWGNGGSSGTDTTFARSAAHVLALGATDTLKTGQNVTASRPSASTVGTGAQFYDTTLARPIWSDGTNWKDADGAVATTTAASLAARNLYLAANYQ